MTDSETISAALSSFTSDGTPALIEIGVHGRWSHPMGAIVSAGISRRLAECPAAIIIDLRDLIDPDGVSLALWLATRRACTVTRPPIRLALCLPAGAMLGHRLRHIDASRLPRFTTMPDAREAMARKAADARRSAPSAT